MVLSQRFELELDADPFDLYRSLRQVNPSPYMYFLRHPELCVVGSSPEPMVQLIGGRVISRPIAGTRRRGRTDEHDRRLAAELIEHPKERAEHVMLVDLARNDVGRVVDYGTEQVDELMTLERYSHVMHLTSQVSGRLRHGLGPIDVLRATLPAGTVSGAPKVRAMQIIDELEPAKRGPYAGVIGYFDFSGNLDTAIAIRTMLVAPDGTATVQAGAGIVADSDPADEDLECRNKAAALLAAVPGARRITAGPASWLTVTPCGWTVTWWAATGPEAATFLQGQLSQDVLALADGASAWSWLLAPTGKVDALVRVTRLVDDDWLLDTDAGWGEAVLARLNRFKLRTKVELAIRPWQVLGLRGRGDPSGRPVAPAPVAVAPWPGFTGVDLLGPAPAVPDGLALMPPEDYEAERIAAGLPKMGAELTEKTIPAETGLIEWTVSFTKGCYTGQELVARIDSRGGNVPRHLRRLLLPPSRSEPGAELVDADGQAAGTVTSAAVSAALAAGSGLGYVRRGIEIPASLRAGPAGPEVEVRELPR